MDVNHCCASVDSAILQEISDYYGILSKILNHADIATGNAQMYSYRHTDIIFSDVIFSEDNKVYDEFINLFKI